MAALEILALEVKKLQHLPRQQALWRLREYMQQTRQQDLIRAINRMKDPELLKILWEAGLNADLQQLVLRRLEEIFREQEMRRR